MIQSTLLLNRINISLYTLHQLGYESLDVDKIWPAPVLSVFPITAVAEKWNSNIKQILDTTGLHIVNKTVYRSDSRGCKGFGLFLHLWRCTREPRQWSTVGKWWGQWECCGRWLLPCTLLWMAMVRWLLTVWLLPRVCFVLCLSNFLTAWYWVCTF